MASPAGPGMLTFYGNQPVFVRQVNARKGFSENGAKTVTVLGALQIAAGFLAVAFQAAATGIEQTSSRRIKFEFVGHGIWCGIMIMVTGLLGLFAGRKKTLKLIVAFLAFNVIVSVTVWTLVGLAAANLTNRGTCLLQSKSMSKYNSYNESSYTGSDYTYRIIYSVYFYTSYSQDGTCYGETGLVWQAMDSLLLVLAIFEFSIAVTSAAYCCRALSCCCQESAQPVFIVQQSALRPAGTYLHGPSMLPTFLQQGASVEFPMFANPAMVTRPVGHRAEVPSAPTHLPFAPEAVPSSNGCMASEANSYYASPTESAPTERTYSSLSPNEPPEYVEIVDTM